MTSTSQQLKEGLLLHVQMNRNFIDQKVYKEFGEECLKQNDITTLNRKKMLKVMKFVFDFGTNQGMKIFYQKLQKNIEEFIKNEKETKPKNKKGNVPIDLQNLVQLIIYCVKNGFQQEKVQIKSPMKEPPKLQPQIQKKPVESPQKDPIKIKQPPKKQQQPIKKQEKKPQITLLNPQLQAKVDKIKLVVKPIQPIKAAPKVSTRLQIDKIPPKVSQFKLQKYEMPNLNVGPKYLQSLPPKPKVQTPVQIPTYQPIDLSYLQSENNKKAMRQRLSKIYQYYCSQQQNKGHSATFDKIKSEMQHMNLGKFLIFCSSTSLFKDCEKIDKNLLSSAFKKIAGGKKEINFDDFQKLIEDIDAKYVEQKKAINGSPSQVATYHSRLRLNTNQGYKQVIKLINLVFFTRDKIKSKQQLYNLKGKFNANKDLTGHSGKFEIDLYEHINNVKTIEVKDGLKKEVLLTQIREKGRSLSKSKPLNIEQMHRKQWPKISWLQQEIKRSEQQNQISQEIMPKISRRKDVVGNIKKRLQQVSKMQNK